MLIKIGRQEAIHKFPRIPLRHFDSQKDEEFFSYPKVFANYILTLPSKSYKGHIKLLGTELVFLANHLECEHFIFLGDVDISWLKRLGTYAIFQDALQYLVDNNIGKSFNGALQVGIAEMPILIQHLPGWYVPMAFYLTSILLTQAKILLEIFVNMEICISRPVTKWRIKNLKL